MGCCGQIIEEINCIYTQCKKTINIPNVIPNSEFTVECSTPELDANLFMQRSIEGCLNCGCEETGYCRCIPINGTVTITPQLTTSTLEECANSDLTVRTYLNDVLIDTATYTEQQISNFDCQQIVIIAQNYYVEFENLPTVDQLRVAVNNNLGTNYNLIEFNNLLNCCNIELGVNLVVEEGNVIYNGEFGVCNEVDSITITFDQKGKYTIKQTVENCCGSCDKTYTVHVGDSLEVFNIDCHQYELTAHVEHDTLTNNSIEVFNVQNQSKSIFKNQEYINNRLKFSVPGDGVWIVKFKQEYEEASPYERTFVVYNNCHITKCIDDFTTKILKNDCNDCKDSVQLELYRRELAEFNVLKSAYETSMNIQFGKRGTSILYDKNELEALKNINFLMQKLNEICGQCETLIDKNCGCN